MPLEGLLQPQQHMVWNHPGIATGNAPSENPTMATETNLLPLDVPIQNDTMIMKGSVKPETVRSIQLIAMTCPSLQALVTAPTALTVPNRLVLETTNHLLTCYRLLQRS